MYNRFLLTIITICNLAFIYYEYKPKFIMSYVPKIMAEQSNKPHLDPRCDTGYFTKKGIAKFC